MGIVNDVRPILYDAVEVLYRNEQNMTLILDAAERAIWISKYVADVFLNVDDATDAEKLKDDVITARNLILKAVSDYWKEAEKINENQRLRQDDRKAAPAGAGEPVRQV